jgi:ATP-binding cassette subfamily B protein
MQDGRIDQDGPPAKLMRSDGPYRRLLLQEMNRLSKEAA